jgi:hypothetical protein
MSQPVIAVLRAGAGPAETALLELLRQETWYDTASFTPVSQPIGSSVAGG